jgi:recombination protein RecT
MAYDMTPQVQKFDTALKQVAPRIRAALPEHLNVEHFCAAVLNVFRNSAELQSCTEQSIFDSVMASAACGLVPMNGHAFLIPYKGRCSFVPGWKGLVHLVVESGKAIVGTNVALSGDHFVERLGTSFQIEHTPLSPDMEQGWFDANPQWKSPVRPITHAYAVGRIRGFENTPIVESWPLAKLLRHRDKYNKQGNRHYSYREEEAYFRKVVLLQVIKLLPQSPQLANAVAANLAAETGAPMVVEGSVVQVEGGDDFERDDDSGGYESQPHPGPRSKSQQPTQQQPVQDAVARAPVRQTAAQRADQETGELGAAAVAALTPQRAAPAATQGPRVGNSGLKWLRDFAFPKGMLQEQAVLADHGITRLEDLSHESFLQMRRDVTAQAAG